MPFGSSHAKLRARLENEDITASALLHRFISVALQSICREQPKQTEAISDVLEDAGGLSSGPESSPWKVRRTCANGSHECV